MSPTPSDLSPRERFAREVRALRCSLALEADIKREAKRQRFEAKQPPVTTTKRRPLLTLRKERT